METNNLNDDELEKAKIKEEHISYTCKSCGGNLEFNPKNHTMKCPYCSTEEEFEFEIVDDIKEYDIMKGISNKSRDWGIEMRILKCESCGSTNNIDTSTKASFCPFCGSSHIVSDEMYEDDMITPETIIPFKIEKKEAKERYKEWINKLWFAPNNLKMFAESDSLQGVYIPFWTYDADTTTIYNATRGDYYYVTHTTYENGQKVTRTEQKIRWTYVSGTYARYFDDILVSGSKNIPQTTIKEINDYNLKQLINYNPKFLSGFLAERYTINLETGWNTAKIDVDIGIEKGIINKVGGDICNITYKNTNYNQVLYKHLLLPIWLSTYKYKNKLYKYYVNGATGKIYGTRPYSIIKILLFTIFIFAISAAIVFILKYYSD